MSRWAKGFGGGTGIGNVGSGEGMRILGKEG